MGQGVLNSLKSYYEILKKDLTKDGSVSRKLFLESITGSDVQSNNLLSSLAELMGVRKTTMCKSAKNREKLESDQKLVPILTRMQRKSPQGPGWISTEWKIKAVEFYEMDAISDIIKGHNYVYKVRYSEYRRVQNNQ